MPAWRKLNLSGASVPAQADQWSSPMTTPETTLTPSRLRALAHIESAALAPQVSASGEAMKAAADEIERLRAALRIIAGEQPCIDNLLGNSDVARIALHGR
jgi:hypothetical protein